MCGVYDIWIHFEQLIYARLLLQFKLLNLLCCQAFPHSLLGSSTAIEKAGTIPEVSFPGYGMVKQACDVMQIYAYVCLPANLYLLLEESLFSVEILHQHSILRE